MKPFSPDQPRKAVSRAVARNAALANQLATPGLGSLMTGRWIAGMGQLVLALAGFGLIIVWFTEWFIQLFGQVTGNTKPGPHAWLGESGLIIFVVSWFWALVTSISLLRQAKADGQVEPKPIPPRMADLSGQPPKLS